MTTKVEKEFFEFFGIKPRYKIILHSGNTIGVAYTDTKEKACKYKGVLFSNPEYPSINERTYLELLVCVSKHTDGALPLSSLKDIRELKDTILETLMRVRRTLLVKSKMSAYDKDIKNLVKHKNWRNKDE